MISYGPCQMPTLGFVVDRYIEIRDFIPEDFWYCSAVVSKQYHDTTKKVEFSWEKDKLFDENSVRALHGVSNSISNGMGNIEKIYREKKNKRKPLPLTTVNLQKIGTTKLRMSGHDIMNIAEKLYTNGYVSYPRTETDQFDVSIDLKRLIGNLADFPEESAKKFINNLQNGNGFENPRRGNSNDGAHPPIHPVKLPNTLTDREFKVYNLIARHFLACCSKDAVGEGTKVEMRVGLEYFKANGTVILEKNYLDIYHQFDKWNDNELPPFTENEYLPVDFTVKKGVTSPAQLLTESDLITMMEKNQIGTDATIHEHIKTIQDRKYALKQGQYFKPSHVGVALIETYNSIGIDLAKPRLRAQMERDMNEISKGKLSKESFIQKYQKEMGDIFKKVDSMKQDFITNLKKYITLNENLRGEKANPDEDGPSNNDDDDDNRGNNDRPSADNKRGKSNMSNNNTNSNMSFSNRVSKCSYCNDGSIVVRSKKDGGCFLSCNKYPTCQTSGSLPNSIKKAEMTDDQCKPCGKKGLISYKIKLTYTTDGTKQKTGKICIYCTDAFEGYKLDLKNKTNYSTSETTARSNTVIRTSSESNHIPESSAKNNIECFKCGMVGHYSSTCSNNTMNVKKNTNQPDTRRNINNNNTQSEESKKYSLENITCYICKKKGHFANNCTERNNG